MPHRVITTEYANLRALMNGVCHVSDRTEWRNTRQDANLDLFSSLGLFDRTPEVTYSRLHGEDVLVITEAGRIRVLRIIEEEER